MRIVILATSGLLLSGCGSLAAQETTGESASDTRQIVVTALGQSGELTGFDTVSLATSDRVEIDEGATFSVRAEGDSEAIARLEITVEDGALRIGHRDDIDYDDGQSYDPVTIYVGMPTLAGLSLAGSGTMRADSATGGEFAGNLAGSGNIMVQSIRGTRAVLNLAGSGNFDVGGAVTAFEVNVAGSGDVAAGRLRADRLEASIAGSGDVDAYVSGTAEASFVGSGDVRVRGGARCSSTSMGSGELICS